MPGPFPFDVFLSHSSKDKSVVRAIAERLRRDGLKVWFDEWALKPGDNIPSKIEEGLEHSRILVLCMSANAFGADWPQLESQTFRFRDPLNKDRRFLPLRLDEAPIKGVLAQFLHLNWLPDPSRQDYQKLLEACKPSPTQPQLTEAQQRLQATLRSLGHTSFVNSVAWSPDGRRALSGAADNTVRLWEVESGRSLRVLEGHTASVRSVAWSPDGRRALSAADDNTVRLWDVESGRSLRVLEGHAAGVNSVAWSPDGRRALSAAEDQTVRLWEVKSGRSLRVLEGHTAGVNSVAWSPDGRRALSAAEDQTVRLWEVESGRSLRVLEGHTASVRSVAWSPDGRRALSAAEDQTVRLWEVESGRSLRVLEGHTASVRSVAWSPDGRRALSGAADQTVRLWEVESGRSLRVLEGHTASVRSVAWSPDGRRALSAAADKTVRLWEVESGRSLRVLEGHTDSVWSVAWSPDGRRALSGAEDQTVRLWEVESGRSLRVLEGHTDSVWSVAWSPDGRRALSAAEDKTVRLWEVESGRSLRVLEGHTGSVWSVAWSPDGRRALSGAADKTVRLWEVESGRSLRVLEGHTGSVMSVAWSPDGRRALSGAEDKTVRLWEVESGRSLRVLEGHTASVRSVAWSPDGRRALSAAADKTVRLWEVESGRSLRVLEGHTDSVWSVAWSPDGRRALSGAEDKTVRLWEVESGRSLRVLEGHTDSVWSVAWSPDGEQVFSAAANGVMRIWDIGGVIPPTTTASSRGEIVGEPEQVQYTNAKVLLVGESGAGKTGLTERLANDTFTPSYSTSGAWSTQWPMRDLVREKGWERELWLWDFGGQADQRLIHQLFLDKTSLILLVFNSDRDTVLPGLREWRQALHRSLPQNTPTFLIAGRTDAGRRFDREKVQTFAAANKLEYFETSAQSGDGCDALRKAIQCAIPWATIERRTSPVIFKLLKDEILRMRDEGQALLTFKELRETLRQRLPPNANFKDQELETAISLLDGPGVVKELNFGTYILLRPEWINIYAQAVIRTLKAAQNSLGCLPVQSIAEGKLIFQTAQANGEITDEKRLKPPEEAVVLLDMEQALVARRLCLKQDGRLVFPSYYGLEQPSGPTPLKYFVSYTFGGFLDDIYATLVVKLVYCGAFKLKELWRDAADFETIAQGKKMGVKLLRADDGQGELRVHFEKSVSQQERVIFATYIHDHLKDSAPNVARLRWYVCEDCDRPVKDRELAMQRLQEEGANAKIICQECLKKIPLWDRLEELFADDSIRKKVASMRDHENSEAELRRNRKWLIAEVMSRVRSADQKCFEIPGVEDDDPVIVVEFLDSDGKHTGKRLYLLLKFDHIHLQRRKRDNALVFKIENPKWANYWAKQTDPVLLVIGKLTAESDELRGKKKNRIGTIQFMEIGDFLRGEKQT